MSLGIARPPFRNASRFLYTFSFFLVWMGVNGLTKLDIPILPLVFLQAYSLLWNSSIFPTFPFTELAKPPSYWFNKKEYDKTSFPYFTGYINNDEVKPYLGGFSLNV